MKERERAIRPLPIAFHSEFMRVSVLPINTQKIHMISMKIGKITNPSTSVIKWLGGNRVTGAQRADGGTARQRGRTRTSPNPPKRITFNCFHLLIEVRWSQ